MLLGYGNMQFTYSPAIDLDDSLVQRLGRYPRVPDFTWDSLRSVGTYLALAVFKAQYGLVVEGILPACDRLALVANHQSHLDTITLLAALPVKLRTKIAVLAAEDYFFQRLDRAIVASVLCQAVAFDRLHLRSLRQWQDRVKTVKSGTVLFYPSGSRSSKILHVGLLKLFLKSGWTVVPVRIEGTQRAWTSGASLWRPFEPLKVKFLPAYIQDSVLMQLLDKDLS